LCHAQLNKDIQELITVEFDEDGLRFSAIDGHSKLPWPKIFKWRQNDQFILVYKVPHIFHIVPSLS
jgi:YcxB-like protein